MKTFGVAPISRLVRILIALLALTVSAVGCESSTTLNGPVGTPSAPDAYANSNIIVSAAWLHTHLNDPHLRIVDFSPIRDYQQGHIPGAVHLWWQDTIELHNDVYGMMVGEPGIDRMVADAGITPDSTVVLYDSSGDRWAARFLWVLNANGFDHVAVLNGGRQAWIASHFSLTTSTPTVPTGHLDLTLNYKVLIGSDSVASHLHDSSYTFVDNRTASEEQQTWYDKLRIGRIPGAVSVPWDAVTQTGSVPYFKSPAELQALFQQAGVTPDKHVVVYGLDGVTAAQTYLALKLLGFPSVLVYDGSWAQWGSNASLPIEPLPGQSSQQSPTAAPSVKATP